MEDIKQVFHKALVLETAPVEGTRDFEASLSWEGNTCVRSFNGKTYVEVLLHDENSVDFSRLNPDGSLPLLFNHDLETRIGKALNVKLDPVDKKLRATVRIGKSAKANDLLADIQDGTFDNMSIGYMVNFNNIDFKSIDGTLYGFSKWMPYECSMVPVAEDVTVGINKAMSMPNEVMVATIALTPEDNLQDALEDGKETAEETTEEAEEATCEKCNESPCVCETEEVTTVTVCVEVEVSIPTEKEEINNNTELLSDNTSSEQDSEVNKTKAISISYKENTMEDTNKQEITVPGMADFGKNGLAKYSVAAHIKGLMTGSLTGVEKEVAQELGSSNIIPTQAFAKANFNTTTSTGGSEFNIPAFGGFLDLLLPGSVFDKLGCPAPMNLEGSITLPGADTPVPAAVTESTGAGAALGAVTTRNILFDAKIAVAQFKMSNKSLIQSTSGIESYLKSIILKRQKFDFESKAMVQVLAEITNAITITGAVVATHETELLNIVKGVTSLIDLPESGSFLTNWNMMLQLQGLKKSSSIVEPVATANTIWNYPAVASAVVAQIAAKDPIVYGDWSRCQLASFGPGVSIIVDQNTAALSAETVITAQSYWDAHLTDLKAFAIAKNAV